MIPIVIPPAGPAQNPEVLRQFRLINDAIGSFSSSTATGDISSAFTVISSSSATTQTLPSAAEHVNRSFTVKNRGTGRVTVSPQGSETIDGKTSAHIDRNGCISVLSDGSNWVVLTLFGASYS